VASDLPEAYVIFETLNDRGADLTTADLLKNYLFSQAKQNFSYVQAAWTRISSDFDKSAEFVKFIRYDYMARNGHVTARNLYKAIQDDIGTGSAKAKAYIGRLDAAKSVYLSLRDVDSALWDALDFDMRDSVLAMRRFGLESSYPLILAVFAKWKDEPIKAAKLFTKITNWSIRALFSGKLGGSVAEKAFSDTAKQVSDGKLTNQSEVRSALAILIVEDGEFSNAFVRYGNVTLPRAKYLLAMLERAHRARNNKSLDGLPDWASRTVTLEHLMPRAEAKGVEAKLAYVETLGNMALLEKALNRGLEDKPFAVKREAYSGSTFDTTSELATEDNWTKTDATRRMSQLGKLAPMAWPA
jgi:hypothetical protein